MRTWARIGAVAVAIATLGVSASAAGASATPGGVTPDLPTGAQLPRPARIPGALNLDYQGGPVLHSNRTHIIFWNPSNCSFNSHACSYDSGYQALVSGFLANVAADSHKATNVFAITGQYSDFSGHAMYDSTYAGATNDTDAAPANGCTLPAAAPAGWGTCLSNLQIKTELSSFVSSHGLPDGPTDVYFMVTPEGFGSCFGAGPSDCSLGGSANAGYCGYHSFFGTTIAVPGLFANIPFNAEPSHCQSGNPRPNGSTADTSLSTLSHELSEAITDPFPAGAGNPQTGWVDSNPSSPTFQEEIGDLCATSFGSALGSTSFGAYNETIGSGHYVLQEEWSNEDAGGSCQQRDEVDTVRVSGPSSGIVDEPASFSGSATDPDGSISTYAWNFGDGSALATGTHVSHTFSHAGLFAVTLSIQDVAGQRASAARTIRISVPRITRLSSASGKHKSTLSVSVNAPGTVRVGGASKVLTAAGTAKFKIALGAKGRRKLSRRGVQTVRVKVKVTFSPLRGGAAETRTPQLTFRG